MNLETVLSALHEAQSALELIAAPARPDGTYNRDRRACGTLAQETLRRIEGMLNNDAEPKATPAPAHVSAAAGKYIVNTDGACKGNPGPAAWGVVIVADGNETELKGFIGHQTNQIAELQAAIEGLSHTPVGATVELVSDSQYTLKGLTEWRKGWERNNWLNSQKQPVANQAYWKQLFALWDARKVTTRWVKGHNGDPYNERCDALANQAIAEHFGR